MLIATFGPSTGWVGKTITYEDERFTLEGHGLISAADVLMYERQGHISWAYAGLQEWVQQIDAPSGAAVPQAPSSQAGLGGPVEAAPPTEERDVLRSVRALRSGEKAPERIAAARALGKIGDPGAVEPLGMALEDKSAGVREASAEALGRIGGPRAVELLGMALEDKSTSVHKAAANALARIGDPRAVELLAAALTEDWGLLVRIPAAEALGKIGGPRAVESLGMALEDGDSGVQKAAAHALARIGGPRAVELLAAALKDGHPRKGIVHFAAVNALVKMGSPQAVEALGLALHDETASAHGGAAAALAKIGSPRAVELLGMALEDKGKDVYKAAYIALGKARSPRAWELRAAAEAPAKSGSSSIYDRRDQPAYRRFPIDPGLAENPHILRWWTPEHDKLLTDLIARWQWDWSWEVKDEVLKITPADVVERWRTQDPACERSVWYNVIMYFAQSRAGQLGLTDAIREPEWKTCPLCDQPFVEDSLPFPLVQRLGIDQLDFCAPCMRGTLGWDSGDKGASEESILEYLRDMADATGRVPAQGLGEGKGDLLGLDTSSRVKLLKLLEKKPAVSRVQEAFGSWLNALIQAGVLEDGTRRTSRGIQTIAQDGHVCLSLGEKTIDDWLFSHGIPHEKEPPYPVGNYRADWRVGDAFIEYFGLVGNPDYDEKTREKVRICEHQNIALVAMYPKDLASQDGIDVKLASLVPAKSA